MLKKLEHSLEDDVNEKMFRSQEDLDLNLGLESGILSGFGDIIKHLSFLLKKWEYHYLSE